MRRVEFQIDENDELTGVKTISIVDEPAIDSEFVAFSKQVQFVEMAKPYKQILAGLALIPDKDIPRVSSKGERYIAYFTKEGIEKIRNKFHKQLMNNNVNVDHKQEDFISAYMVESFLIDSEERLADVSKKGIKDPVMGSWFVAYKIDDSEVFTKALAGELKGFSVEIFIMNMFEKISTGVEDSIAELHKKVDQLILNSKQRSLVYEEEAQNNKLEKVEEVNIRKRKLKLIQLQHGN